MQSMEDKTINDKLAIICPDPIIGVNREGVITLFNPAAEKLLGYSAQEVVDQLHISQLYHPATAGRTVKRLMYDPNYGPLGQIQSHESQLKSKQGRIIPIRISATLILDGEQEMGSIGFFHDLTESKTLEATLKQLSITDGLTGLFNHHHFQTLLSEEIERSNRYNRDLSLVCIDMDNFKSVNDQLGHVEGDLLLKFMGQLILGIIRASDYGFRFGGDEFMILLPETCTHETELIMQRLRNQFNKGKPTTIRNSTELNACVNFSYGIADYLKKESAKDFINRADLSMYEYKRKVSGLNREKLGQL